MDRTIGHKLLVSSLSFTSGFGAVVLVQKIFEDYSADAKFCRDLFKASLEITAGLAIEALIEKIFEHDRYIKEQKELKWEEIRDSLES